MVKPIKTQPNPRRNDQMPLCLFTPPLPTRVGQFLQRMVEPQIKRHAQGTRSCPTPQEAAWPGRPPWPEERTPRNPPRLLEALIKRSARWAVLCANLRRDGEHDVEGPRRAFLGALVRVVRQVEQRDEQVVSGEEDVVQLVRFRVRY